MAVGVLIFLILLCQAASPKYYVLRILIFDQLKYWPRAPSNNARCIFPCGLASKHVLHGHMGCLPLK